MNANEIELLESLAKTFGTTVEHLWGVLLRQAPISGTVDLLLYSVLVYVAVWLVRKARYLTTVPAVTETDKYPHPVLDSENGGCFWAIVIAYIVIVALIVLGGITTTVAAFLNPEYWALMKVLSHG